MSKQMTKNEAMRRIDQAAIEVTAKNALTARRILEELISDTMGAGNLSEDLHGKDLRMMAVQCTDRALTRLNLRGMA